MANKSKELNREIESRIEMEIVVDAYNELERAMGWYYYLQDNLAMPFKAECIQLVSTSPLKIGEIIEVVAMDSEESCGYDMFVKIKWKKKGKLSIMRSHDSFLYSNSLLNKRWKRFLQGDF